MRKMHQGKEPHIIDVAAELAAHKHLKDAALVPVWGSDHWTLMGLEKDGDGKWKVDYKDSLQQESMACRLSAAKILQVFASALGQDLELPQRSNRHFQTKGSLACGFFVVHWIDQKMRQIYHGEGHMCTGVAIVDIMRKRLGSMIKMWYLS